MPKTNQEKAGDYLSQTPKTEWLNDKESAEYRWWMQDDDKLYQSVFAVVNQMESDLQVWRFQCKMYRFLYGNPEAFFVPNTPMRGASTGAQSMTRRTQINTIQSCVDTAASMIAKNRPKPQFMTLGQDDYKQQERAKNLTKYCAGVNDSCGDNGKDIYGVMKKVFYDAAITGTGALKIMVDEGKVKCEWIFNDEIIVDNAEGMRETPSQIHQRKFIARDVLLYKYPKFKDQIMQSSVEMNFAAVNKVHDLVEVLESWHMKSGKNATDGRHTICIDQCTLLSEQYDKDYYPIVFFRWAERPLSFWGRGIAEELVGIQMRINEVMKVIQVAQELIAVPVIYLERGSDVTPAHIAQNGVARIVWYTGTAPITATPQAVQPELYQYVDWLINQAFQISGVSQAGASGTAPQQLKSGEAIREASDMAQGRFELVGQEWERCFITASKIVVDLSADLYKKDKNLTIKVKGKKFLEKISWADAALDPEEFAIQVFPISSLADSPADKLDQLADWVQAGWIDKSYAMELGEMPDNSEYVSLQNSSLELVRKSLSDIVNEGKYLPPTQFMNLQQALQIANLEYNRAENNGVEQDKLNMISLYIDQVNDLITMAQPPAPPPQQAPVQGAPPNPTPPAASQAVPGAPTSPQQ
jgi:hypothetical protein